ncbi:MAG: hypothetical protein KF885_00025 [Anaerolineales bacterium]|nr:hypothetical protein [Anaerolineales bacterium]
MKTSDGTDRLTAGGAAREGAAAALSAGKTAANRMAKTNEKGISLGVLASRDKSRSLRNVCHHESEIAGWAHELLAPQGTTYSHYNIKQTPLLVCIVT